MSVFSSPYSKSSCEGLRGMKTGGVYLQDELLEKEKHECPQRNDFFLGWPRTICSRGERV